MKRQITLDKVKGDINEFVRTNTRVLELVRKTLRAYREYVKELERYTLR
jgi:hypothetical protein